MMSGNPCREPNMIPATFRARNFRVLPHLDWSPSGLCLLTGANGTGKSTCLDALKFLRVLFERGHQEAVSHVGGSHFRSFGTDPTQTVEFEVEVGDLRWSLRFPMSTAGLATTFGEELHRGDTTLLRAGLHEDWWTLGAERRALDSTRCGLKVLYDQGGDPDLEPLAQTLRGIRVYESYWLNQVKRWEPVDPRYAYLHRTGQNLWSVLANWKAAPRRYGERFEWVLRWARRAFPDLISAIEFDQGLPYIFTPGSAELADALPPARLADGLLVGLLHLTALSDADTHSLIAFDEVENHLHPHAIRTLLEAMRERVDDTGCTVLLTTHSPVVLNGFRDAPEQVFVLESRRREDPLPVPMTSLHSEAWLAQAKLGSLYERLAFGAPPKLGTSP